MGVRPRPCGIRASQRVPRFFPEIAALSGTLKRLRPKLWSREAEGGFFTERRLQLYASGVVLSFAALFLIRQLIWRHFILGHNGNCLDFTWIWLSSKLALSGALAQAYTSHLF